ncbi:MAG: hypothetical protein WC223_07895 [Bacteroidales bacterium]|jgi:hypothetical protein
MRKSNFNALLNEKLKVFVLAFFVFSLYSCGNVNSKNTMSVNDINKKTETAGNELISSSNPTAALDKAKKDRKVVFLVITGTGATGLDKVVEIAKEANGKVSKSIIVQMNKDEATNSSLVTKLGIASVPVPFIVVISSKGIPVAGFPSYQVTTDLLIKSVPSPKEEEIISVLSEKKPVFIVISKKGLTDKKTIIANCKAASSKIASKPAVVEIDYSDSKESAFLTKIGVTSLNDKTITLVINSAGQIADKYEGVVLESALTTSASKVIKSGGCCPGGSSKGCGPKK